MKLQLVAGSMCSILVEEESAHTVLLTCRYPEAMKLALAQAPEQAADDTADMVGDAAAEAVDAGTDSVDRTVEQDNPSAAAYVDNRRQPVEPHSRPWKELCSRTPCFPNPVIPGEQVNQSAAILQSSLCRLPANFGQRRAMSARRGQQQPTTVKEPRARRPRLEGTE